MQFRVKHRFDVIIEEVGFQERLRRAGIKDEKTNRAIRESRPDRFSNTPAELRSGRLGILAISFDTRVTNKHVSEGLPGWSLQGLFADHLLVVAEKHPGVQMQSWVVAPEATFMDNPGSSNSRESVLCLGSPEDRDRVLAYQHTEVHVWPLETIFLVVPK